MPEDTPEIAALKAAKAKAELERDIAKAALEKNQSDLAVLTGEAEAAAKAAKARAEAEAAAEKARAELERDIAKAALEKRQSERALLTGEAEAAAKEAKAALEKQQSELATATGRAEAAAKEAKARAEAEAAAATAEGAVLKARIGTLEGSGITGSVTAEAGSAAAEAGLLAAWAIDAAAERIAAEIGEKLDGRLATNHFVIFTGTGRPRLADWQMFEARRAAVAAGFAEAEREAARAAGDVGEALAALLAPPAKPGVVPGVIKSFGLVGALPAAGAVIDAAAKLGSFFQSEFKVAPVTVAGADDDLLALSLAGRLPRASYPARWPAGADVDAEDAIRDLLGDLLQDEALARAGMATAEARRLEAEEAAKESTGKDEKAAQALEAKRQAGIAAHFAAALKAHDGLLDALAAADQAGTPLIARVLEQKTVARHLRGGALALMVQVSGAAGTTYTQKNLWTFLGSMPFYVSGGAVARYVAMEAGGIIRAAGQVPVHSGYHAVHAVAERFQRRF